MKNPLIILKRKLRGLSISGKILAISALSSFVTLSLLCSISFYRDWLAYKERKETNLSTLAEILASSTVASLRFDDAYAAKEYVDSVRYESDIESVTIYDSDGEAFAFYCRELGAEARAAPEFRGERWESGRLYYARDIALGSRQLGTVLIEMDTASFWASVIKSLVLAIAFFMGGIAISVYLAARMQRLITGPLGELVDVTHNLTEGEELSARALKYYDDEVGQLVDSFNRMVETIGARDASLREINSSLERVVEERTEDLRARNAELNKAMESAKAASIAKSEFLATTSHELRTPLNPIIGYVEKMQREEPGGKYARELQLIRQSAQQLLRLIDEILDFSRIERGVIRLSNEKVDIQALCEGVLRLMEPQASQKGLDLLYSHRSDDTLAGPNALVLTDEGRLRQVVLNLVSNAIKFTRQGHVKVRSELFGSGDECPRLRIEIKDTGIGIAPSDQDLLFKPFSQIDGTWTREFGGMGLGLAISQKIVSAMHGSIRIQSETDMGSTFTIEIPVETIEDEPDEPVEVMAALASPSEDSARVLLVEDELVNRELMSSLLAGLGHHVVIACNGLEAIERAQEQEFDFVLLDISMPKMDGFEATVALRRLNNRNGSAPIVAMTAHVTPEDRERCFRVGMDDYLSKPVSFTQLKATLERWLERKSV